MKRICAKYDMANIPLRPIYIGQAHDQYCEIENVPEWMDELTMTIFRPGTSGQYYRAGAVIMPKDANGEIIWRAKVDAGMVTEIGEAKYELHGHRTTPDGSTEYHFLGRGTLKIVPAAQDTAPVYPNSQTHVVAVYDSTGAEHTLTAVYDAEMGAWTLSVSGE